MHDQIRGEVVAFFEKRPNHFFCVVCGDDISPCREDERSDEGYCLLQAFEANTCDIMASLMFPSF